MPVKRVHIGTRGSSLALAQSGLVRDELSRIHPGIDFELKKIVTSGDAASRVPMADMGKGIFTKEIEQSLLRGECNIAVHSLKDMPVGTRRGLEIGAVMKREDARDVIISNGDVSVEELGHGAVIGTSSVRRRAQLLAFRKDFVTRELRGNVDTRIRKLRNGEYGAIVLAAAGVIRLGLDSVIAQYLPFSMVLPAPGQGALAVQVRSGDHEMAEIVKPLEDDNTRSCVEAERGLLEDLGGGCEEPISAYARAEGDRMILSGMVASADGTRVIRIEKEGKAAEARGLARELARELIDAGAGEILKELAWST